jgi:cobalt-zinc-cadmium resistance protein CzcA
MRDGPAQISREPAKRRIVVGINVAGPRPRRLRGRTAAEGGSKVQLPEGYYFEWGGQFQNMERAWAT